MQVCYISKITNAIGANMHSVKLKVNLNKKVANLTNSIFSN